MKNAITLPVMGCVSIFSLESDGLTFVFVSSTGLRAVAHLWQEFVLEMRYRWENDIFIPR